MFKAFMRPLYSCDDVNWIEELEKHLKLFQCSAFSGIEINELFAISFENLNNFISIHDARYFVLRNMVMVVILFPEEKHSVSSFSQNKFYLFSWKVMTEGVCVKKCEQTETKQDANWKLCTSIDLAGLVKLYFSWVSNVLYFSIKLRICYQHLSQLFKDYFYYYFIVTNWKG